MPGSYFPGKNKFTVLKLLIDEIFMGRIQHQEPFMKNEYEIIGKAVHDILDSEMSEFLDQILLSRHLREEYSRLSKTDAPPGLKRLYESAIDIVGSPPSN